MIYKNLYDGRIEDIGKDKVQLIARPMRAQIIRSYTQWNITQLLKNTLESVLMGWMKLEPITQSGVSQKHQYGILTCIYEIQKDGNDDPMCKAAKETQM